MNNEVVKSFVGNGDWETPFSQLQPASLPVRQFLEAAAAKQQHAGVEEAQQIVCSSDSGPARNWD